MLFKIYNSFFYTQKVAYFVQKQVILLRSNPTYLRCVADQTRSKYDQPTLYPRSTYDLWRAGSSPAIFQPLEKVIPLTTTSQSGPDQPPLYFRPTYALPDQGPLIADPSIFPERERAGVDRLSGVNGPLGHNGQYFSNMCDVITEHFIQDWTKSSS